MYVVIVVMYFPTCYSAYLIGNPAEIHTSKKVYSSRMIHLAIKEGQLLRETGLKNCRVVKDRQSDAHPTLTKDFTGRDSMRHKKDPRFSSPLAKSTYNHLDATLRPFHRLRGIPDGIGVLWGLASGFLKERGAPESETSTPPPRRASAVPRRPPGSAAHTEPYSGSSGSDAGGRARPRPCSRAGVGRGRVPLHRRGYLANSRR